MNYKERRERNTELFQARRRGLSLAVLARTYDLSERQCRRIIDHERERHARAFDQAAEDRLEDHVDSLEAMMEDVALIAQNATCSTQRVKALEAKRRLLREQWRVLDDAGLLPRYSPRPMQTGDDLAVEIVEILKRGGVPNALILECTDKVSAWTEDRVVKR
jgi:hypothetical protein